MAVEMGKVAVVLPSGSRKTGVQLAFQKNLFILYELFSVLADSAVRLERSFNSYLRSNLLVQKSSEVKKTMYGLNEFLLFVPAFLRYKSFHKA